MKPKIRMNGILWGLSIELLVAVVILLLVTLSCGVMTPAAFSANAETLPAPSVNKKPHTNTLTAEMMVCGRWNIRPEAGDLVGHKGWLEDGQIVTVKLPATVTEDKGTWYELAEGGWVNGKFLCQ